MRHLGLTKVSCLWRCPQFRGVLIEELHCIIMHIYLDVVGNDGDILEVESCINLIHHIERRRLIMVQSKHL